MERIFNFWGLYWPQIVITAGACLLLALVIVFRRPIWQALGRIWSRIVTIWLHYENLIIGIVGTCCLLTLIIIFRHPLWQAIGWLWRKAKPFWVIYWPYILIGAGVLLLLGIGVYFRHQIWAALRSSWRNTMGEARYVGGWLWSHTLVLLWHAGRWLWSRRGAPKQFILRLRDRKVPAFCKINGVMRSQWRHSLELINQTLQIWTGDPGHYPHPWDAKSGSFRHSDEDFRSVVTAVTTGGNPSATEDEIGALLWWAEKNFTERTSHGVRAVAYVLFCILYAWAIQATGNMNFPRWSLALWGIFLTAGLIGLLALLAEGAGKISEMVKSHFIAVNAGILLTVAEIFSFGSTLTLLPYISKFAMSDMAMSVTWALINLLICIFIHPSIGAVSLAVAYGDNALDGLKKLRASLRPQPQPTPQGAAGGPTPPAPPQGGQAGGPQPQPAPTQPGFFAAFGNLFKNHPMLIGMLDGAFAVLIYLVGEFYQARQRTAGQGGQP